MLAPLLAACLAPGCASNRLLALSVPEDGRPCVWSVAPEAAAIDAGDARAYLRGYLGWDAGEAWSGSARAEVLGAAGESLGVFELTPVTRDAARAAERRGSSVRRGHAFAQAVLRLPRDARSLRVETRGRTSGLELFLRTDPWRRRMPLVSNASGPGPFR